jgi:hypothetical protein
MKCPISWIHYFIIDIQEIDAFLTRFYFFIPKGSHQTTLKGGPAAFVPGQRIISDSDLMFIIGVTEMNTITSVTLPGVRSF